MAKTSKKRTAKKKTAKKKAALTNKVVLVTYKCAGGKCKAMPKRMHADPLDVVKMSASNTDVTLTFATSPFTSGRTVINITAGNFELEEIASNAAGSFPYNLACSKCPSVAAPPEMIVP
jgi:hypothetical protein